MLKLQLALEEQAYTSLGLYVCLLACNETVEFHFALMHAVTCSQTDLRLMMSAWHDWGNGSIRLRSPPLPMKTTKV